MSICIIDRKIEGIETCISAGLNNGKHGFGSIGTAASCIDGKHRIELAGIATGENRPIVLELSKIKREKHVRSIGNQG